MFLCETTKTSFELTTDRGGGVKSVKTRIIFASGKSIEFGYVGAVGSKSLVTPRPFGIREGTSNLSRIESASYLAKLGWPPGLL